MGGTLQPECMYSRQQGKKQANGRIIFILMFSETA